MNASQDHRAKSLVLNLKLFLFKLFSTITNIYHNTLVAVTSALQRGNRIYPDSAYEASLEVMRGG